VQNRKLRYRLWLLKKSPTLHLRVQEERTYKRGRFPAHAVLHRLFAELKNQIGLRRLRLRRMKFVREQFFLAAAAQNLKRLVRFLARTTPASLEVTASGQEESTKECSKLADVHQRN